jgi:two-component system phosphate regulon sensor histidine kinase PhoR
MGVGGFLYLFIKQRKLSEMKTDFVNMLSHEFKTPVATISLISEVLGRNNSAGSQEKIHRYAGILQAEIARLKLLVDKTLQVASFDNKTVKLELVETNINKLVQESSDYISATFDKNKPEISFNFNITNDTIVADEAHLRNVFLNILDNSIKYSVNPVQIQIKTYQEANDFIIEIADNGSGIEKKNLPHIFDKFYRVSTGNVHNIQGAGLGLYYSKQIIEFHKGNIIANSSLGKGTTMFIRLPKN